MADNKVVPTDIKPVEMNGKKYVSKAQAAILWGKNEGYVGALAKRAELERKAGEPITGLPSLKTPEGRLFIEYDALMARIANPVRASGGSFVRGTKVYKTPPISDEIKAKVEQLLGMPLRPGSNYEKQKAYQAKRKAKLAAEKAAAEKKAAAAHTPKK